MEQGSPGDAELARQLERELRLVHEGILLVASGATPSVLIAGLRLGEAILEPARTLAREAGVRVVPQWFADERGLDIRVEGVSA